MFTCKEPITMYAMHEFYDNRSNAFLSCQQGFFIYGTKIENLPKFIKMLDRLV